MGYLGSYWLKWGSIFHFVLDLEDYLFDQGFEVRKLPLGIDQSTIDHIHHNYITTSDAIMIFYSHISPVSKCITLVLRII